MGDSCTRYILILSCTYGPHCNGHSRYSLLSSRTSMIIHIHHHSQNVFIASWKVSFSLLRSTKLARHRRNIGSMKIPILLFIYSERLVPVSVCKFLSLCSTLKKCCLANVLFTPLVNFIHTEQAFKKIEVILQYKYWPKHWFRCSSMHRVCSGFPSEWVVVLGLFCIVVVGVVVLVGCRSFKGWP